MSVGLVCWWCGSIECKVVGRLVFLAAEPCKIHVHGRPTDCTIDIKI